MLTERLRQSGVKPSSEDWAVLLGDQYWRLNNLYQIKDKNGQIVTFRFNPAQEKLWQEMHTRNVILKARQLGFTTFIQLYMLDCCLFNPNISAGVIAHKEEAAKAFFKDKIKFAYDRVPVEIRRKVPMVKNTEMSCDFANGSTIRLDTSLRSGTIHLLHISELGTTSVKAPDRAKEIVTGSIPAVPLSSTIFIESTAEGAAGEFYDLSEQAQSDSRKDELQLSDWKFFFVPWFVDDGYELDGIPDLTDADREYFDKLEARGIVLTEGQKAWYMSMKRTFKGEMRKEYPATAEEAFQSSVQGAYWAEALTIADEQGRITDVPVEDLPIWVSVDLGVGNSLATWATQQSGGVVRVIDYFVPDQDSLPGLACIPKWLKDKEYFSNLEGLILPHDATTRDIGSGEFRYETFIEHGIPLDKLIFLARPGATQTANLQMEIEQTRKFIPRCYFDKTRCAEGLKGLRAYRRVGQTASGIIQMGPMKDWASHPADSFRYLAQGLPEPYQRKPRQEYVGPKVLV